MEDEEGGVERMWWRMKGVVWRGCGGGRRGVR